MKFCWCTITVNNLEESIIFYRDVVGLKERRRLQTVPGVEIVFLGNGETQVELLCNKNIKKTNIGADISLGFQVDSLEDKMAELKSKGIGIQSGIIQPNPAVKFFYVLDPNGLKIQFVEMQ
ncbi:VOC family protein [Mobilitalea sibirica]|uniref:VOC family protein n=1 Tax=Mobilitalea sibirica TaxID=1462919 RepID=A0A8J7GYV2_9FIRM|nr:VOC family protein [Mobilitalea sibirica]MBH1940839.1 VOC family protein [Mobilitalea sibirica]